MACKFFLLTSHLHCQTIHSHILEKIVQPLTYAWNHPSILDEVKSRTILFKPEVSFYVPLMYFHLYFW